MPRSVNAHPLAAFAACLVACTSLPDPVPYQASVGEKAGTAGAGGRIKELEGAQLALDGRVLGKVKLGTPSSHVVLDWTGPKADVKKVMNGKYTLELAGACGPVPYPLEGPTPLWRNMSERELAEVWKRDKNVPVYLDVTMPKTFPVYVDWGKSRGKLTIGVVPVEVGKAEVGVVTEGCKAGPTVTLDGVPLGTIDLSAQGALVTLEAGVCHVHQEVAYGDRQATKPSLYFPAQQVVPLPVLPGYFLESAPTSLNLSAGTKGTVISELLRARCR